MTKCWKWRPSSRPSFSSIIKMIDAAVDALREADYVNLADIVMNDVKEEVSIFLKLKCNKKLRYRGMLLPARFSAMLKCS